MHWITKALFLCFICFGFSYLQANPFSEKEIPLPEHPRPDFARRNWLNLNGPWQFRFDKQNTGLQEKWFDGNSNFPLTIMVPFSWGSKLSGVQDDGDIGWYARRIDIPDTWENNRIFLVIGACDWKTTAWLDGKKLGEHQGGYTPFEFELRTIGKHQLVIRVDDTPHKFKLEGKQGYGRAAGIWQTIYLEARAQNFIKTIHFTPDIDKDKVTVNAALDAPAARGLKLALLSPQNGISVAKKIRKGQKEIAFDMKIERPHLWSLNDPYLYNVKAVLQGDGIGDTVSTYFGMRKISVMKLPGTNYSYIALNNKPIYLELTLDQAYHADGFYTFPSDKFMRDEILRTRRIGLNGQRIHVKIGIPRKLYWADRLGVLIMADVPNSWGEPDADMRSEMEYALRNMIKRDYNHPAIFSWVLFNETWGLRTKRKYEKETQKWVASIYDLTKKLDPSRLVEDNSADKRDHVVTDVNSWHSYLPGYGWKKRLDEITKNTFPGSKWNFAAGHQQAQQPNLNSECGNVWGYKGSTGDVDWSWDYHRMMNEFRRHPAICGWLYTEHHDVINEWNGYYRFDRSKKFTGFGDIFPGMSFRDLHSDFYLSTGQDLCRKVKPGGKVRVPLFASFMTDKKMGGDLVLRTQLFGWDNLGRRETFSEKFTAVSYEPWMNKALDPVEITMPDKPALVVLGLSLEDADGTVLQRNFTTFLVNEGQAPGRETVQSDDAKLEIIRFAPDTFHDAKWSLKQWNVLDGLKVDGAGSGYFEYRMQWPSGLKAKDIVDGTFRAEVSAKQLFGKDKKGAGKQTGNFMLGKGTHDPSLNPNSYPMTDEKLFPSAVSVAVNGHVIGRFDLPDDPADSRGILSWFSQKQDRTLHEAGSYGYLINAHIPGKILQQAEQKGEIVLRLRVDDALPGGLAIYGERFGRYPVDPMLILKKRF